MNLEKFFQNNSTTSNTARGILSGVIGGLAGIAIKSTVELFLDVRKVDQKSAQLKIIDELSIQVTGKTMDINNEGLAEQLINVPLGISVGAAYGYGKQDDYEVNILDGVMLGTTTWASTHETTLPLVGLKKSEEDIPIKTQLSELFSHVLYGVTTEIVRAYVNDRLQHQDKD